MPADFGVLMHDPDTARANRAMQAVFGMKKIDIAAVHAAADETPS